MSWLNENAGAIQAVATVVLVLVTWVYVRSTKRIAGAPHEERKKRQDDAKRAVRLEMEDIVSACPTADAAKEESQLPTYVWDTMKGDLATVPPDIVERLHDLYGQVRRANGHYQRYAHSTGVDPSPQHWKNSAMKSGADAADILKQWQEA